MPPPGVGAKQANKGTLQIGFSLRPIDHLKAIFPHVRRRCRQHAQVAESFKATVRCDAQVVLLRQTVPGAFFHPLGQ